MDTVENNKYKPETMCGYEKCTDAITKAEILSRCNISQLEFV